jgi:hypothetical protein
VDEDTRGPTLEQRAAVDLNVDTAWLTEMLSALSAALSFVDQADI